MFSGIAYENADACRFCWMCRHLCPIGLRTGKEINGARAKGLAVSMMERGMDYDASVAAAMWECALCGSCTNDCATGYEPRIYIREARSRAIALGIAPEPVMNLYNKMMETGNLYGRPSADKFAAFQDLIASLPQTAPTLLYIGDVAAEKAPEIAKASMSILKKAGVDFTVLSEEPASGAYLGDLIGFVEEVRAQAVRLYERIKQSKAERVVVLDPIDARMILHEYGEWGLDLDAGIVPMPAFLEELVRSGKMSFNTPDLPGCTFHDAGALSRDLHDTSSAREVLKAMGIELDEMFLNRDLARSCGGALLLAYAPELAGQTAQGRFEDAARTRAGTIITEAPGSYAVLKAFCPAGMAVIDLTMLADQAISQ
jgi:Fe-S oxidoreductase